MAQWQPHASVRGTFRAPNVADPGAGEMHYCGECGRPFPSSELVAIGPVSVCATCKPIYLQRLREGGAQAVGTFRYAGFWIRFAARMVDGILLQAAFLVIRIPLGISMFSPGMARNPGATAAAISLGVFYMIMTFVLSACYEIFFIAKRGATLGKMVFGLKVIRVGGGPVSLGLSTGRYFAQWISAITLSIGYIMAGFDDQKRALHDRICDTRVIRTK